MIERRRASESKALCLVYLLVKISCSMRELLVLEQGMLLYKSVAQGRLSPYDPSDHYTILYVSTISQQYIYLLLSSSACDLSECFAEPWVRAFAPSSGSSPVLCSRRNPQSRDRVCQSLWCIRCIVLHFTLYFHYGTILTIVDRWLSNYCMCVCVSEKKKSCFRVKIYRDFQGF